MNTGGGLCPGYINALCNITLAEIANKVIDFFFIIGGPIAGIMILVGGFQIMTAAGDPQKFTNGRNTILYAAIGLVVIVTAKTIVSLVQSIFS